jgi:outer membrane autotransporter protein
LNTDGFTETGAGIADLVTNEDNTDSLRGRLGGRVSYPFKFMGVGLTAHLNASYQHEFIDQARGITSQFDGLGVGSFVIRTPETDRDSVLADVGMDADLNRTVTIFADYLTQAGQENYLGQSGQVGIKLGF